MIKLKPYLVYNESENNLCDTNIDWLVENKINPENLGKYIYELGDNIKTVLLMIQYKKLASLSNYNVNLSLSKSDLDYLVNYNDMYMHNEIKCGKESDRIIDLTNCISHDSNYGIRFNEIMMELRNSVDFIDLYYDNIIFGGETVDNISKNKKGNIVLYFTGLEKLQFSGIQNKSDNRYTYIEHNDYNIILVKIQVDNYLTLLKKEKVICYQDKIYSTADYCQNNSFKKYTFIEPDNNYNTTVLFYRQIQRKITNRCYVCREKYTDKINCIDCIIKNRRENNRMVDLTDKLAFITGGRTKIGFYTTLKLLRMGCSCIVTTRYPNSAIYNYRQQKDYDEWKDRLLIYQLNLVDITKTENLCKELSSQYKFDIIINNACQTIKPSQYYLKKMYNIENSVKHLIDDEKKQFSSDLVIKNDIELMNNKFYDIIDKQNVEEKNSWEKELEDIDINEILECNLVNQIAPTIIIKILSETMNENSFILNVTSSEGNFNKNLSFHPHTNMTKASLDMLTKTLHDRWKLKKRYVFSVDPGYVSGIPSFDIDQYPLEPEDGATRVLYPMIMMLDENVSTSEKYKIMNGYRYKDFRIVRN